MKRFLTKHIFGIIGTILLAAIILLSLAAFTPTKSEPPITDVTDTSQKEPLPNDELPPSTPEAPTIPVYEGVIPRPSTPSESMLFEQKIAGNGDIRLCDVLQTAKYTYIIAESDCRTGDLAAERPTVGIVRTDSLGNIDKSYPLKNNCDYYYLAATVSNVGLVVALTDKAKSYIYITVTDYELTNTVVRVMSYSDSVTLIPTADSFLVFTDNGSESFIVKYADESLAFSALDSGKIVEVFEFGDFYRLFYNTATGYGMTDVDKRDFSVKKEMFVASATLNCIIPIFENGVQTYIAVETESGLFARKYYSDVSVKNSERKKIGSASCLGYGTDGRSVYLCVGGGLSGVITLKPDLSLSYSVIATLSLPSRITDYNFTENGFVLLLTDAEGRLALVRANADGSETSYLLNSDDGKIVVHPNGSVVVVAASKLFDIYECIEIFGIK